MIITGVSIAAVSIDNDQRTKEECDEDETDKGVKKVRDTGVFTVTSIFSMVAYGWMLYVLWDSYVELWEAIVTFALFWIVMAAAYTADQINAK